VDEYVSQAAAIDAAATRQTGLHRESLVDIAGSIWRRVSLCVSSMMSRSL
jgi:hypothetical protein